jgi:tetratricopeptide (TPR) repeat protein
MKKHEILSLYREERATHELSAAFLPGYEPLSWLEQLSAWNIPLLSLRCFLAPKSRTQPETIGLFVLFPNEHGISKEQVQYPYGKRARLWLPLYTDVQPAVTDEELEELCSYQWQFFHPSIGFVGYQTEDELDIRQLLLLPKCKATRWDKATAAPPRNPSLRQLNPPPVSSLDFVAEEQQSIGEGSEDELLDEEQDNSPQGQLLRGIRDFANRSGQKNMADWAQNRLRELARKRKNTVDRLKEMLEKDPMKALKYAPPLSEGKDDHRGRDQGGGGSTLTPRDINFDLSKLRRGGSRRSNWNIGNNNFLSLRQQYYQLAIKLMEAGELRKAAYVYAHLLEDYRSAANVLQQGGFYLEAAALFREKLKDRKAEAECLSKGRYFLQAAEVYTELAKWVSAAPLYILAGEKDKAIECYEKAVKKFLKEGNYLSAAKIVAESLKDQPRATALLLEGWKLNKQPEGCLTRYFHQLEEGQVGEEVERLFSDCPNRRYESFLNVLLELKPSQLQKNTREQLADIALRAVSTLLKQGKQAESYLTKFIPHDKLLPIDLQRLNDQRHLLPGHIPNHLSFSLNQHTTGKIDWLQMIRYYNFTLALGYMGDHLILARSNKNGYAELKDLGSKDNHQWVFLINRTGYDEVTYIATPTYSSDSHTVQWSANTHFPLMDFTFLGFLPSTSSAVGILPNQNVLQIEWSKKHAYLQRFTPEGELISKLDKTLTFRKGTSRNNFHYTSTRKIITLGSTSGGGYFFTCSSNFLLLGQGDRIFGSPQYFSDRHLIIDYDMTDIDYHHLGCLIIFNTGVDEFIFDKQQGAFINQRILSTPEVAVLAKYIGTNLIMVAGKSGKLYLFSRKEASTDSSWIKQTTIELLEGIAIVDLLPHYPKRYTCSVLTVDGVVQFIDLSEWIP